MEYEQIRYDVEDGILTLTLSRPERLNAYTGTMQAELIDALDRSDADDDVRAVIVTGEGRAFCAGADLGGGGSTFNYADQTLEEHRDGGGVLTLRIFESKKPIIAAVNGPAVGVGATMQLAMDVRLASDQARVGFVFTRRGIVPEACSGWFLPRAVGISRALEWAFTGRIFTAEEGLAAGLFRSIHAPDELIPAARALATEIRDNTAPVAVALARQEMWRGLTFSHPMDAHIADSRGIYLMGQSPDVEEGVNAFLEKRSPNFPMKVSKDLPDLFPHYQERRFPGEK